MWPFQKQSVIARPVTYDPDRLVATPRVCAVFDRPWLAKYSLVDDQNARYVYVDAMRLDPGRGAAHTGHALQEVALQYWQINSGVDELCPWCGSIGLLIHCMRPQGCDGWVCAGRTTHNGKGQGFFRCRDSCGITGYLMPCHDRIPASMNDPAEPGNIYAPRAAAGVKQPASSSGAVSQRSDSVHAQRVALSRQGSQKLLK